MVTVELMKSYCLLFIMYATKAVPLIETSINLLNNCINAALYKIFKVNRASMICLTGY